MPRSQRNHRSRAAALVLAAALATALPAAAARAADPPDAKVERQIGVMEKILDKVLIDSPNFLVGGGGENTRGLYIEEVGALFTFEAALTNNGFDVKSYLHSLGNRFEVKTDEDGNQIIVIKKDKEAGRKGRGAAEDLEALEDLDDGARTLALGRDELVQALLDYGETLSALDDEQWVIVAAFLPSHDPRHEGTERLVMRARMADLRAYSEGRLGEQEMRQKIRIEES